MKAHALFTRSFFGDAAKKQVVVIPILFFQARDVRHISYDEQLEALKRMTERSLIANGKALGANNPFLLILIH